MNSVDSGTIAGMTPTIVIGIVGFCLAVAVLTVFRRAFRRWRFGDDRERIEKHWADIEHLARRNDLATLRLALIQADAVLDLALKAKAFPGATTGERLSAASKRHRELKRAFWARALRNTLVHEAGATSSSRELRRAIHQIKNALTVLGAL